MNVNTMTSGIINGKPYTRRDSGSFEKLSEENQLRAVEWVKENFIPTKTPNFNHSSYGLKHILERDIGIYMENNAFKGLMLKCGFYPVNVGDLNWCYCISKKSPGIVRDREGRSGRR